MGALTPDMQLELELAQTFRPYGQISLKVRNIEFNFDVYNRHCLLSTHTSKSNLMLGTHLHAIIRTHHFDFDVRF